jgi:methionine synthase II (cobalamin-independent)
LQIDEPVLSMGCVRPELAKNVLNRLVAPLPSSAIDKGRVSIHACGPIKRVYNEVLLGLDIPVLSLGFSGEKERGNIDVISRKSLEDSQKKLGVGFVSNVAVEDVKTSLERLASVAQTAGRENIACVHPDCGFGLTPPEKVRPILENMKRASDAFIQSL